MPVSEKVNNLKELLQDSSTKVATCLTGWQWVFKSNQTDTVLPVPVVVSRLTHYH